ncbi:Uncharacterised protein [Enterobacter hormaechei]|nr:Uncharacterised protein [Enterobacter hormaechei]
MCSTFASIAASTANRESVRIVGISAVKDLLTAGGTFSPSEMCSAFSREMAINSSVESSPISTPAKIPVEPILANVSTWVTFTVASLPTGVICKRIGIMMMKLLTAITTAETGLSKSLLRASDKAIIGASSSAAMFSVPLMIASPHTLNCVSVSPSKIQGNTTLFTSTARPARMKIGITVAKASRRERRCTWFARRAENSTNLSTKDCMCGVIFVSDIADSSHQSVTKTARQRTAYISRPLVWITCFNHA